MRETTARVPENSASYREFARLYEIARQLRPTGVDRWNGELYATTGRGRFDQPTGAIGINQALLRDDLTGQPTSNPRRQARALATVLNRAAQAGTELDEPGAPNAVRTNHSLALADGTAWVRAGADFRAFARMAGYPHLAFDGPPDTGAYAAANGLVEQASGTRVGRLELLDQLSRGPVVMQFDRLAEGVVRNRLAEVAPAEGADQRAIRAQLIGTMLHPRWAELAQRSPETGRQVAEEIGRALNSKVDELRHRYQPAGPGPASDDVRREHAERRPTPDTDATARADTNATARDSEQPEVASVRFLDGVAPASGAAGRRPVLGDGSRAASVERGSAAARSRGGANPRAGRGSG